MNRVDRDGRTLFLFAAVSVGLVALGIALLARTRVNPQHYGDAVMAEYYLSMLCRCHWYGGSLPWSIHGIAAPYRYRVLVPWLAGHLPFAGSTSLAVVTYACLAAFYFLILVSGQRLRVRAPALAGALLLPFVFESHLVNYFHPFLVEGFGLMIIAGMLYALAIDSFWLFAGLGLCGIFAREVTWFILPVWCARNLRRGVTLTIVGGVALLVEHSLLWGPPVSFPIDPTTIALWHWREPSNFVRDIRAVVGWEFGVAALGLVLLPAAAFRTAGPMALGLLGAACLSSFLATDTARLFGVMFPVVVLAVAQLISVLVEQRRYLLLASLGGLVVMQYLVTPNNGMPFDSAAITARLRPIRLGTLWTIAAAFLLRRDLAAHLNEKLAILRSRRWWSPANVSWRIGAAWAVLLVMAVGGVYRVADPEKRDIDQAVRSSVEGQFIRLTDGYTHFAIDGPADAPLVVLAAGISEPSDVWTPTSAALTRAGFRVLTYDYYGRGYSDRPNIAYTPEVYVRQLAELLDSQRIAAPVHLGGLAFGASVMTSFADRYPARVRSLIFVGPAFHRPAQPPEIDRDLLRQKGFESAPVPPTAPRLAASPILWEFTTAAFEERWWPESNRLGDFLHPERFPDWPDRYQRQMQYRGFRRAQRSTLESYASLDQAAELTRVGRHGRPVIAFWGKQDAIVPMTLSTELTAAMPRARLIIVESAGHFPHWEQPASVNPPLIEFLQNTGRN